MIERAITEQIMSRLGKGKVIILVGARQVGKTTLTRKLTDQYSNRVEELLGLKEKDIMTV